MATIAVECGHVSGLFDAAILTTAGPDVVREAGPDQFVGLDTRDPTEGSPASTTDRTPSCHQHLRNRDGADSSYGVGGDFSKRYGHFCRVISQPTDSPVSARGTLGTDPVPASPASTVHSPDPRNMAVKERGSTNRIGGHPFELT